jgi:hypothetical protein
MRIQNKWVLVTKENEIKLLNFIEDSNVLTQDSLNQFNTFVEVYNFIIQNELDVSHFYREEFEEILSDEELQNAQITDILNQMNTYEIDDTLFDNLVDKDFVLDTY